MAGAVDPVGRGGAACEENQTVSHILVFLRASGGGCCRGRRREAGGGRPVAVAVALAALPPLEDDGVISGSTELVKDLDIHELKFGLSLT